MGIRFVSYLRIARSFFAGVLFAAGSVSAGTAIDRISAVRSLSSEEAAQGRPVFLDAQVLRANPLQAGFFVASNGDGCYVQRSKDLKDRSTIQVGDLIRICGVTSAGEYSSQIVAKEIVVLASQPLPEPRPFTLADILDPAGASDWVSVSGRLTSIAVPEGPQYSEIMLTLEIQGAVALGLQIPVSDEAVRRLPDMMFRRVRVPAILGTVYNGRRQMASRTFLVQSIDDFELLAEDRVSEEPQDLPVHRLLQSEMDPHREVRTRGTVTYVDGQEIFLRGGQSSVKAVVPDSGRLRIGQTVELEGFVWPQPVSPAFRARVVRVIDEAEADPVPMNIPLEDLFRKGTGSDLLDSRLNYELVRVKVHLVDVGQSFGLSLHTPDKSGQWSLLCRSGERLFEARLPAGMNIDGRLRSGAALELTGICNLIEDKHLFARLHLKGLWLQLRGPADVVVIDEAPWWTLQRMVWISSVALGIAVMFFAWVVALHRTVDRQTAIIRRKVERESILNERQRIARELHDNVEQGLAGMAIHLKGCQKLVQLHSVKFVTMIRQCLGMASDHCELKACLNAQITELEKDTEQSQRALKLVQSMLIHCSEESRSSIMDLRGGPLERMDFMSALREVLGPLAEECGAELTVRLEGAARPLKQVAERHLLLVAKEAASNAARHAAPGRMDVVLTYGPDSLSLMLTDNGCGFLVDRLPPAGRFGLQGMHERINHLNGEIRIDSTPGAGTTVQVNLHSTAEWELTQK